MWGRIGRRPSADKFVATNAPIPLRWGSTKTEYLGDGTGQGNNIAYFDTWVNGICAQLDLWRNSPKYKDEPFNEAIAIWSGGNNVESYIQYVLGRVPGMRRDTTMNDVFWKGPMGLGFLKAQAAHEAGQPTYPAPAADWLKAQQTIFGGPRMGTVKSVQLNVRARARTTSDIVVVLDQGAQVQILAEVVSNGTMRWLEITQGYVAAAYVAA